MNNENELKALAVLAELSGGEPAKLLAEHDLVADLGIDSPRALELLIELEDALGVEVSDEEAEKLVTVGDVLQYARSVAVKE